KERFFLLLLEGGANRAAELVLEPVSVRRPRPARRVDARHSIVGLDADRCDPLPIGATADARSLGDRAAGLDVLAGPRALERGKRREQRLARERVVLLVAPEHAPVRVEQGEERALGDAQILNLVARLIE